MGWRRSQAGREEAGWLWPNSIGYVELIYAVQNKLGYGSVKNLAGNFVKADANSVSEAAAGDAKEMPADFRVSITNVPGKNAYPISTFTGVVQDGKFLSKHPLLPISRDLSIEYFPRPHPRILCNYWRFGRHTSPHCRSSTPALRLRAPPLRSGTPPADPNRSLQSRRLGAWAMRMASSLLPAPVGPARPAVESAGLHPQVLILPRSC
jgi:hypothetical protein